MEKISDTGGQVIYRQGNRFGLLFVILIPAAIVARIWFELDWMPVLVLCFMGAVMLYVSGMREQIVIDVIARTVTCSESYLSYTFRSEQIPFDRVTGLSVTRHYERDKPRGPVHEAGFRMSMNWKAEWGGGGSMLAIFHDEESARREAGELARRMGKGVGDTEAAAAT